PPTPAAAAAGFDAAARGGPAASARAAAYRTATPAYASCEQLQGQGVDTRDDVYSLACIGYEVITGKHPFGGLSALEARAQRLRPRRPAVLGAAAWRALRRGLAWEREHRPRHLPGWLAELGIARAARHLPPSHELRATQAPRFQMRRVAAAAILLVITGTVAFALLAP